MTEHKIVKNVDIYPLISTGHKSESSHHVCPPTSSDFPSPTGLDPKPRTLHLLCINTHVHISRAYTHTHTHTSPMCTHTHTHTHTHTLPASFWHLYSFLHSTSILFFKKNHLSSGDFPDSPILALQCRGISLISGQGAKMPHALGPKNQTINRSSVVTNSVKTF